MKNILINSYACGPNSGSEGSVGWSWVRRLSKFDVSLTVIVENEFKQKIEKFLLTEKMHNVKFVFVKRKRFKFFENISYNLFNYLSLFFWQIKVLFICLKVKKQQKIDTVHHLNMIGFREPGLLWIIPNVKYIHGPVGGGGMFCKKSLRLMSDRGRRYYRIYNLINLTQSKFSLRFLFAKMRAGHRIFYANSENRNFFNDSDKVIYIPADPIIKSNGKKNKRIKNIVWVGVFEERKKLDLFLEIMDKWDFAKNLDSIDIFGVKTNKNNFIDFNENEISKDFHRNGINLVFHGEVSQNSLFKYLKTSSVMAFTSLREGTPLSIIEAYNLGLKVVCFETSGMVDMLVGNLFVKLDNNKNKIIDDFRMKIEHAFNPKSSQKTTKFFTDEYRNNLINKIYDL
jgi:glycosyltransferase involved in cell wall biosynthesis